MAKNPITITHPEIAEQWHPVNNGEMTPDNYSHGSNHVAWWLGDCGHEWESRISKRTTGQECPYCSNKKVLPGFNDCVTSEPELTCYWDHDRNIDYFLDKVTAGSKKKAWWKCSNGHSWEMTVRDMVNRKNKCMECVSDDLVDRQKFTRINNTLIIDKFPEIVDFIPDIEKSELEGVSAWSMQDMVFTCPDDHRHTWTEKISSFYRRSKDRNNRESSLCPVCSHRVIIVGVNDLGTTRPDLASELVDPGDATTVTKNSSRDIEWKCDLGHTWIASPHHRSRGTGCPYCSGSKVLTGFNDISTTHPTLAAQLCDQSLATRLTASSGKKVSWICDKGHTWESTISSRNRPGSGCPYCSNRKILVGFNDLATTHPDLSSELSDPSLGTALVAGSMEKVSWTCDNGHTWDASVAHRCHGSGCPYCANRRVLPGFNSMSDTHPELAQQLVDQSLSTSLVSGTPQVVDWVCEKGHTWSVSPNSRVYYRTGCPYCINYSSKAEKEVADYVESILDCVISRNTRKVISPYELDIYISEKNIAIEYNGIYWHSEKFLDKSYHYEKWKRCHDYGIQLITVWEDEWLDKQEIVKNMLSAKLGVSKSPRVYARKTTAVAVNSSVAFRFLEKNHIQGGQYGSLYSGLMYDSDLVAVAVWKKSKDTLYLDRYATSCMVIGGMGKLLKQGIKYAKENGCTEIVTFADHQVSDGGLYEKLGFRLDKELKPDYKYVVNGHREHKFGYRLKRFRDDPNLVFHEGMTEKQLADINGLERVWDCGKSRYVYDIMNYQPAKDR